MKFGFESRKRIENPGGRWGDGTSKGWSFLYRPEIDTTPATWTVLEFWGDGASGYTKYPQFAHWNGETRVWFMPLETIWRFINLRQWSFARMAAWDYLRGRKPERITLEEYSFLRWGDPSQDIAEFNRRRRVELGEWH